MERDKNNGWDRQTLGRFRDEIDRVDEQLISLLLNRQEIAAKIGQIKRELGIEMFDHSREEEVLRRVISKRHGNLSEESIRHIFTEIISAARSVQKSLTVAFLGPEATFCHQAALRLFGRSTLFHGSETMEGVFDLVEKDVCQQGVVPVENSYEGSVNSTLDLLCKYELKIASETFLRIRHHLLSRSDNIEKIHCIYSHPMAIAQCKSWIKEHLPQIPVKEQESTSIAAKRATKEPSAAAVGSRMSALNYGLNIVEENIEDNPHNVTRFLGIGKNNTAPTGTDKTSILFLLNHQPGALHKALAPLARRDINMSRIESRPIKMRNWEYLFFVDLEGHEQDNNVHEALKEIEGRCSFVKRLGSYPAGGDPWD